MQPYVSYDRTYCSISVQHTTSINILLTIIYLQLHLEFKNLELSHQQKY